MYSTSMITKVKIRIRCNTIEKDSRTIITRNLKLWKQRCNAGEMLIKLCKLTLGKRSQFKKSLYRMVTVLMTCSMYLKTDMRIDFKYFIHTPKK